MRKVPIGSKRGISRVSDCTNWHAVSVVVRENHVRLQDCPQPDLKVAVVPGDPKWSQFFAVQNLTCLRNVQSLEKLRDTNKRFCDIIFHASETNGKKKEGVWSSPNKSGLKSVVNFLCFGKKSTGTHEETEDTPWEFRLQRFRLRCKCVKVNRRISFSENLNKRKVPQWCQLLYPAMTLCSSLLPIQSGKLGCC